MGPWVSIARKLFQYGIRKDFLEENSFGMICKRWVGKKRVKEYFREKEPYV